MKQRSTTCLLAFLLPLFFACSVFAQTAGQAVSRFDRRMIPPSPEAAQLGVFGSAPPDLNTGAVQTTVPLLEVKSQQLSLSVALHYHYTGLQVTEVAPWVGLGWTLSAGGVITRTVQGLPDEWDNNQGYIKGSWSLMRNYGLRKSLEGPLTVPLIGPGSNLPKASFCQSITEGGFDSEPDAYNVSTPFYSGKLFLDSTGVITCSPHTDVRFSGNPGSAEWTAVTGDGTVYVYIAAESTAPIDPQAPGGITATTAWYLSTIVSADGQDRIDLEYNNGQSPNAVNTAYTVTRQAYSQIPTAYTQCNLKIYPHFVMPGVTGNNWSGPTTKVTNNWLTRITTSTTRVDFISDTQRGDITTASGDRPARRLVQIVSRDVTTQQPKIQYDFAYHYFNASGDAKAKRLRLARVKELGKPSYVFSYDTTRTMPSRESFARDHWGYYNGKPNSTLMPLLPPELRSYQIANGGSAVGNAGADRSASGTFAQVGALTRVQYPTGGWTQFAYEPNVITVPCDYAAIAVNQFGGVASVPLSTFYAAAQGGQDFHDHMTSWESTYAGTSAYVDASYPGAPPVRNINARQIDALTGFTVADIRCTGVATSSQTPSYGSNWCTSMVGAINTYLYKLNADSVTLDRLCKVGYDVASVTLYGARRCTTSINTAGSDALRLQHFTAGRYYLIAEVNSAEVALKADISMDVFFDPDPAGPPCSMPLQVGGIRLAKTMDVASVGDTLTKTYRYRQPLSEGGASSGVLFFKPEYAYRRPCAEMVVSAQDVGKTNWLDVGYHIGYGRVEVESQGRQAGTTVYYYYNDNSRGPNCRSLVTKVEELNQAGGLVKQTTNTYRYEAIAATPGFRLTKEYDVITLFGATADSPGTEVVESVHFWFASRLYYSYWPKLVSTTERIFGTGAAAAGSYSTTTGYTYLAQGPQSTTQPIRVAKQGTNGQWQITHTRYAGQYGLALNAAGKVSTTGLSGASALGLVTLVEKHLISVPIEHQQWVRTGTDSAVVGGDVTHFAGLRPARIFALTPTVPVPGSQFLSSRLQGTFQQDSHYLERVSFPLYSPLGSLLQQRVAQAPPSSYLWGYAESKLIAEVQNAAYAQIAFTSFEPDVRGRWQYDDSTAAAPAHFGSSNHFTGTMGYKLDDTPAGAVRRTGLPAGDYEVLVWGNGANVPVLTGAVRQRYDLVGTAGTWRQHRYRLTVAANATLQLQMAAPQFLWIDELRLVPLGARMTSYTHDPLVGMTSQTDPSGRTTTYEYDAMGRLIRTRDEQGRILSQQQYHYAGQ